MVSSRVMTKQRKPVMFSEKIWNISAAEQGALRKLRNIPELYFYAMWERSHIYGRLGKRRDKSRYKY